MKPSERDPKNGMLVGPDGCHYENEHQVNHYARMGLCGCSDPAGAYNFVRSILERCDARKERTTAKAEDLRNLIAADPDMATHVMLHLLTELDLLEHGSSVQWSWPTEAGLHIVDMRPAEDADFEHT